MGDDFTILFVDPELALTNEVTPQLEAEGYKVIVERNGEDALFSFERVLPHLVIVELDLAGLTGQELCAAIKNRTGDYFVPVLFTGNASNADEKAAGYEAGADDFIAKPFDLRELSARIKSLKKIHAIANRNLGANLASTYADLPVNGEAALKVIADNLTAGRRAFRLHAQGQSAFVATDRRRVISARAGELAGRAALDQALLWSLERIEIIDADFAPNLDLDFDALADWALAEIDLWRLFTEKLVPRTFLRLHPAAAAFAADIPAGAAEIAKAFETPATIDTVLRGASGEWTATAKAVADLYYRGFLLYVDGPAAAPGLPFRNGAPALHAAAPSQDAQQLEDLQLENLTLTSNLQGLAEENAALKAQAAAQASQLDRVQETQGAATQLEARVAELDEELMALKRRYATRLKDLAAKQGVEAADSVIQQLSFDLQDAHTFAVQVQNAKVAAEKQVSALRNELAASKHALEEATGKAEQLQKQQQSATDGSKLRKLQDQVATLKGELAASIDARGRLQEELRAAPRGDDAANKQLQADHERLQAELADVRAQNQRLQEEVQRCSNLPAGRTEELQAELADLRSQLALVTAEKEGAVRQMQTAAAESTLTVQRLDLELAALRNALDERSALGMPSATDPEAALRLQPLEDENSLLREQLAGARSELEALRQAASQPAAEAANLQEELARAHALLAELQEANQLAQDRQLAAEQAAARAAAEAEGAAERVAELEASLAAQQAQLVTAEALAKEAAGKDTERDGLEEEIALLKEALTEAMVAAEKYQRELEAAQAGQSEAASRLQADLFSVSAQLSQAQATIEELEGRLASQGTAAAQGEPLDAEVAFLKAKLNEVRAAEAGKQQQLANENAALKQKVQELNAQRQALEDKVNRATDPGITKRLQSEIDVLNELLARMRDENEALTAKIGLANASAQKNTLLIKAQDQADTIQTLKASLRQRDQELAALKKALEESAGGILDLGAADETSAAAETGELQQKLEALRAALLERDEEIVELTAKLQQLALGAALLEVPE